MAILKNSPLNFPEGAIHGKVGGLIFRQVNGKTVISLKPASHKASQKPECVAARNKFKTLSTFATFLNRIPVIKNLWTATRSTGSSARNRMIKYNYAKAEEKIPTSGNTITPPGHHFNIWAELMPGGKLRLDPAYGPPENLSVILAVMVSYDPVDEQDEDFIMTDHSVACTPDLTIDINFPRGDRYRKFILYTALIAHEDEKLKWSDTWAIEGLCNTEFHSV